MTRSRLPAKVGTLLLLAILVSLPLFASVFMRLRSSATDLLKATGGRLVYEAQASVNGTEAKISVLGFDGPLRETAASVRSLWKLPPLEAGTAPDLDGAWITADQGKSRRTLLLFPGHTPDGCSAWLVEMERGEGSGTPPPPPGGNPLPSADLLTWIENGRSRTLLTVHETTASPAAVIAEVSEGLEADGWAPLVEGPSSALYANEGKVAAAAAFPSGRAGVTRAIVIRGR